MMRRRLFPSVLSLAAFWCFLGAALIQAVLIPSHGGMPALEHPGRVPLASLILYAAAGACLAALIIRRVGRRRQP
jgi:hypothetical protein